MTDPGPTDDRFSSGPLSLYIHIPFCVRRCPYCDFNSYAGIDDKHRDIYVHALRQEIRQWGARLHRPAVRTIFIGGGTPTTLNGIQFGAIMATCRESFRVDIDAEISSEANPGAVDSACFEAMLAAGINRLSLGVQSFDDKALTFLGRIHDSAEARAAYRAARQVGFQNINLDFMFGLPGQSVANWRRTLAEAIELEPEHLSLYSLTVEPGTPLARWVTAGKVPAPDDDQAAADYELAMEMLAPAGFTHYEISNWAQANGEDSWQPHYACRHNIVYWRRQPYLGFGAGAHSFLSERRWWNVRRPETYIRRLADGRTPTAGSEHIDRRTARGETMMLGLRLLTEGVSDGDFQQAFGVPIASAFPTELEELTSAGLLDYCHGRCRLTPRGYLLANQVFRRFLP